MRYVKSSRDSHVVVVEVEDLKIMTFGIKSRQTSFISSLMEIVFFECL
jgi:hypothetical protein